SAGTAATGDIRQLDIDLCEAHGQVCVRIEKLSLRPVHLNTTPPLSRDTTHERNSPAMNDSKDFPPHHGHAADTQPASAVLREKSILQFRKLISRRLALPLEAIGATVGFDEYGLDSILVMELTDALRA